MTSGNGAGPRTPTIAIIGAGFGGVGLGIQLKKAGIDSFTILEKADGVGGTWRYNTYPGLTCDVPSHLYSFSFEPKHDWSRRYPRREEILEYLEHCTDRYGLRDHLRVNTEVERADFDEDAGLWRIRTVNGDELEADFLVTATGQLSRPAYPGVPGLDRFEGEMFHSARWNHDYDLSGKRVAAVGTGASAIQYLPEIAPRAGRLHIFQRSPGWVIPKPDRPYRPREKALYRRLPLLQRLSRWRVYWYFEFLILLLTKAQWVGKPFVWGFKRRLQEEIPDPALRERLLPDYPLGCKRILISNDYLPMFARPNVELVTEAIREIGTDSVVTADGTERQVDAIILGTGFQATEFLAPMTIRGLGDRDLNDVWREGAEAYLGLAVSGFPNMFMLYGPNTNLGAGSIIFMLESQIAYVLEAIRHLPRTGARWMDVDPSVQGSFNRDVQERLDDTVWTAGCSSWYRNESGKVTNNWPGFTVEYRRRTRRPDLSDFTLAGASAQRRPIGST
jgi:cation diffusion facilitator CzcD-associated flavoprotein CzcO